MLAALILTLAQQPGLVDRDGMTSVDREKRNAIFSELTETGLPEWAGNYAGIVLAPRSGFVMVTKMCMGPIVSTGSVHADGNRLELHFDEVPARSVTWWLVPWDTRRYLVPEHQMSLFCMLVNDGTEPRIEFQGWPAMRTVGPRHRDRGLPVLPERWQSLVLASPLKARILHVEQTRGERKQYSADDDIAVRVMLRLGSNDDVQPGLGFYLGRNGYVRGFVEHVGASTYIVLAERDSSALRLRPGDYVGTKRRT
jgi:hypothetical protein